MAKSFEEKHLEKLKKLEELRDKGVITEEKFNKEKLGLDRQLESYNKPANKIAAGVALGAILLLIGWFLYGVFTATPEGLKPLNLTVNRESNGLQIVNNTNDQLNGCRLTVNGEYSFGRFGISESRTVPYSEITKGNGDRFNILTTAIQSIVIGCEGHELMEYS